MLFYLEFKRHQEFLKWLTKNTGFAKAGEIEIQKHFGGDHMTRPISRFSKLTLLITMLLVSVFLSVGHAFGQATSSGTVVGTASDPQGAVIAGVTVTLSDVTLKTSRTLPTNEAGGYVFVNVPPGIYSLSASMPGFSTTKIDGLVVSVGTQTTANLKMTIG